MAGTESTVGRLRYAAAFAAGPVEVMDFLLPLWAADEIDASPAAIGAVVALEAALSLAVRPLAGVLADRHDRRLLAAAGAALYAASFLLYAAAPGIALVALGAAIGGAGGALFWVALRAEAGTQLAVDPAAYARLLSGEQYGSLLAFFAGLTLLGFIGYRPVFVVGAAACGAAIVLLLRDRPPFARAPSEQAASIRRVGRRLAPLLAVTALTTGIETGLALLLLLHLQAEFDLEPGAIAFLFLPGAILLAVLPERAYGLAVRLGRARSLVLSLLAGAAFTGTLAVFDEPAAVAVLWALWAAAISIALPVEQTTVAQASQGSLGRGMGLYTTAALIGTVAASPLLASVYGGPGWRTACAVAAGGLLLGAALVPLAVRSLGLPDRLAPVPADPQAGE